MYLTIIAICILVYFEINLFCWKLQNFKKHIQSFDKRFKSNWVIKVKKHAVYAEFQHFITEKEGHFCFNKCMFGLMHSHIKRMQKLVWPNSRCIFCWHFICFLSVFRL